MAERDSRPGLGAASDETDIGDPTQEDSVMYKTHASNGMTVGLAVLGFVGTLAVLYTIYTRWDQSIPNDSLPAPSEFSVFLMVALMGALGGFIHLTSSLAKYVGNRRLLRSWVLYYILMPIEGASLAPIIYLLLRVGVLSPAAPGETGTASLNLLGIYAFAGLTGLFSKQAIDMLADVFATIFKKIKAKDSTE